MINHEFNDTIILRKKNNQKKNKKIPIDKCKRVQFHFGELLVLKPFLKNLQISRRELFHFYNKNFQIFNLFWKFLHFQYFYKVKKDKDKIHNKNLKLEQ